VKQHFIGTLRTLLALCASLLPGCAQYLASEQANRDKYYNALAGYPTWYQPPANAAVSADAKTWWLKPMSVYADTAEHLQEGWAIIHDRYSEGFSSMFRRHQLYTSAESEWRVITPIYSDYSGRTAPVEFHFKGDPAVYWTIFRSIRIDGDPETYPN
jgi:hypothetical protein